MERFIGLFLLMVASTVGWLTVSTLTDVVQSTLALAMPVALTLALVWLGVQLVRDDWS